MCIRDRSRGTRFSRRTHESFRRTEKVLREHPEGDEGRDRPARRRHPGRACEGQGTSRGSAERAEGGAPDVRGGVPSAGNSERPRGSRGTLSGRLGLLSLGLALLASPVPTRPPAPPRRVVALAPSAAEILFALGAAPRVVGVPDFADDLPEAAGKARVGGFAPDLERVVSLAPDLVVVSKDGTDRAAYEKLEALGLTVVVTSGATLVTTTVSPSASSFSYAARSVPSFETTTRSGARETTRSRSGAKPPTRAFPAASGRSSAKSGTPTTRGAAPSANRISAAEGASATTRRASSA